MGTTYPVIEGAYVRDLLEQADSLRRTLATPLPAELSGVAARLRTPQRPSVILTGMGSSYHALHPLAIRLAESGIYPVMLETSELIYYWNGLLGTNTVVIAVSQSGRSAEILRLLEIDAGRSTLIAVTNDLNSPLAQSANGVVRIDAGVESSVSCKTYVSSLLALSRMGEVLCPQVQTPSTDSENRAIADAVDRYIANWRDHVEEALFCLRGVRHLVLAGRGPSLATTGTGGLIVKEAARFPAEGMSAAAFRHGPFEMISNELMLLVFQGSERSAHLNKRLAAEVLDLGGSCQLLSEESDLALFRIAATSESLRPILEILPVQMITLALAAREGREAGAFSRASKITSTE
jgi:glucosamine--fructose-6-phosphate aminotransferase (isomerizing)